MKHSLNSVMLFVLVTTLFLVSCNALSTGSNETEFVKLLKDPSVNDINKSIRVKREADQGLSASPDVLYFTIYNQSSNHLRFSADSNVQIFRYNEDEKKWAEIPSKINYSGTGRPIDPKGGDMDGNPTVVIPNYENLKKPLRIRVAFTAYIVKDGQTTNEPVSAYIDLNIK